MPSRNDTERGLILESEISTTRLVLLALTLHTRDSGNELWGRSHAWYAIDITQDRARAFLAAHDETGQRRMASSALAMAGWTLQGIAAIPEPWCNHDAVAVVNGICECGAKISGLTWPV